MKVAEIFLMCCFNSGTNHGDGAGDTIPLRAGEKLITAAAILLMEER